MDLNRRQRPDPATADRLLAGRLGADDAPPGYRRVAALLGDAGSGFSEPAGPAEASTVSAMVAAIQAAPTTELAPRRSGMLAKVLAAKTVAIVSVLALSASGAAAAATGNLPDAVQDKVANAAKHVGLNLPQGTERVAGEPCTVAGTPIVARNRGQFLKQVRAMNNPEALAAAKKSRCGMPVNSDETPGADESEAPETESPGKNGKSGQEHGQAGQEHGQAGDDQGQAGNDQGAPADTPAAEAPNPGGIDAGGATGDEANDTGQDNADPAAGEGSGNADDQPAPDDHPPADLPTPDVVPPAGS
ncbi:MAG: hypothetical protein ACRD0O_05330 [Acidimicrobiia bacterium]